jgi:uncharacterized membrane protein
VTDRLTNQVQSLFVLGHQRTSDQDIEFGVNQLVEIAVRALSPGLNDPFHGNHVCGPLGIRFVSFSYTRHAVALSP